MVFLYLHWETRNNFQVNGILLLLTLVKLARKTIAYLHSIFAFQLSFALFLTFGFFVRLGLAIRLAVRLGLGFGLGFGFGFGLGFVGDGTLQGTFLGV